MPVYTKVLAVAAQNTYYFLAFLRLATALILSENASLHTLQVKIKIDLDYVRKHTAEQKVPRSNPFIHPSFESHYIPGIILPVHKQ